LTIKVLGLGECSARTLYGGKVAQARRVVQFVDAGQALEDRHRSSELGFCLFVLTQAAIGVAKGLVQGSLDLGLLLHSRVESPGGIIKDLADQDVPSPVPRVHGSEHVAQKAADPLRLVRLGAGFFRFRLGQGFRTLTISGFEALTAEALRDLRAEKDALIADLTERLARVEAILARQADTRNGGAR